MKIDKLKKLRKGQYELKLVDNTIINIHEDLILKYNLLITKDIDEKLKNKLLEENKLYIVYDQALNYLSTKMRSIKEMKDYLEKKMYDKQIIKNVLDKLIKEKYLNDDQYALYFINDKINLSNDGPFKIVKELEKKGINKESINIYITKFNQRIQEQKIEKIINKQIKANHNKSSIILKRKILEYLINLGYDRDIINSKLTSIYNYDDEQIKNKEYEKIYKKLSTKYSGYELEQRVKQKMYEKGFR